MPSSGLQSSWSRIRRRMLSVFSLMCTYSTSKSENQGCGNTFSNGGTIATDGGCTMLCANNKAEYCGGENRVTVYNFNNTLNSTLLSGTSSTPAPPAIVPSIGSYNYYGCQTEAIVGRALSSNSTATNSMTLEHCATWCVGYTFFGTEYGRECKLSNVLLVFHPTDSSSRLLWEFLWRGLCLCSSK
jgi:hypothetical protein